MIVDNGSNDGTVAVAEKLAREAWVEVLSIPGSSRPERGPMSVRAFHVGVARLEPGIDVIVKPDADVSLAANYAERLLEAFAADSRLGIASGPRYELVRGRWRRRYLTATSVEAQARAYRRACLEEVLPLEERMGWDVVDETRALILGWRTQIVGTTSFRHHRTMGARDRSRVAAWLAEGQVAHFVGYRPSYLCARAAFKALSDPAALAMALGYFRAILTKQKPHPDPAVLAFRREQQRMRHLPTRARETLGWAGH